METASELFHYELREMYDVVKRLERGLRSVMKGASEPQLSTKVEDLQKAASDQVKRVEEIFDLLDEKPSKQECGAIKGMLDGFRSFKAENPEKAALDVYVANVAGDIAQYSMEGFQNALQIAEQAGVATASPKIADDLQVSMKEHKKIHKDIQKLTDKLIQQLRPS